MDGRHEHCRDALRRIERNDPFLTGLHIRSVESRYGERTIGQSAGWCDCAPSDNVDFGSIGEAVGTNTYLEKLIFCGEHGLAAFNNPIFFEALERNASIRQLELVLCSLSEGVGREILEAFGGRQSDLSGLYLIGCGLANGGADVVASTIARCKSLERITFSFCSLDDALVRELCPSVGCCHHLELSNNRVGSAGCEALAALLQEPHCNLRSISLDMNNIDDDCATALATALKKNSTLETLSIAGSQHIITERGWDAFFFALCDTASVNDTHSSNHTLRTLIGPSYAHETVPGHVSVCIDYNRSCHDPKQVSIKKILWVHPHIDMEPFFRWDLRVLPVAVDWFDRARDCARDFEKHIDARQLSSIYQFARAMPLMFIRAPKKTGANAERRRGRIRRTMKSMMANIRSRASLNHENPLLGFLLKCPL